MSESKRHDPNRFLKEFFDSLDETYDQIALDTGISRKVLFDLCKPGATIKSHNLLILYEKYGITPDEILLGEKKYTDNTKNDTVEETGFSYLSQVNYEDLTQRERSFYNSISHFLQRLKASDLSLPLKLELLDALLDDIDQPGKHNDPEN